MSDSVWPHRRQPTRLPHSWDSPSKNTGVGCHFLLQCMKVKSESEVSQSLQLCPSCSNPMDCSLPCSSIHGICQARVLEWGAIAFSNRLHDNINITFYALRNQKFVWLIYYNIHFIAVAWSWTCNISEACLCQASTPYHPPEWKQWKFGSWRKLQGKLSKRKRSKKPHFRRWR